MGFFWDRNVLNHTMEDLGGFLVSKIQVFLHAHRSLLQSSLFPERFHYHFTLPFWFWEWHNLSWQPYSQIMPLWLYPQGSEYNAHFGHENPPSVAQHACTHYPDHAVLKVCLQHATTQLMKCVMCRKSVNLIRFDVFSHCHIPSRSCWCNK